MEVGDTLATQATVAEDSQVMLLIFCLCVSFGKEFSCMIPSNGNCIPEVPTESMDMMEMNKIWEQHDRMAEGMTPPHTPLGEGVPDVAAPTSSSGVVAGDKSAVPKKPDEFVQATLKDMKAATWTPRPIATPVTSANEMAKMLAAMGWTVAGPTGIKETAPPAVNPAALEEEAPAAAMSVVKAAPAAPVAEKAAPAAPAPEVVKAAPAVKAPAAPVAEKASPAAPPAQPKAAAPAEVVKAAPAVKAPPHAPAAEKAAPAAPAPGVVKAAPAVKAPAAPVAEKASPAAPPAQPKAAAPAEVVKAAPAVKAPAAPVAEKAAPVAPPAREVVKAAPAAPLEQVVKAAAVVKAEPAAPVVAEKAAPSAPGFMTQPAHAPQSTVPLTADALRQLQLQKQMSNAAGLHAAPPQCEQKEYTRRAAANLIKRLKENPSRMQEMPSLHKMVFDDSKKSELISMLVDSDGAFEKVGASLQAFEESSRGEYNRKRALRWTKREVEEKYGADAEKIMKHKREQGLVEDDENCPGGELFLISRREDEWEHVTRGGALATHVLRFPCSPRWALACNSFQGMHAAYIHTITSCMNSNKQPFRIFPTNHDQTPLGFRPATLVQSFVFFMSPNKITFNMGSCMPWAMHVIICHHDNIAFSCHRCVSTVGGCR